MAPGNSMSIAMSAAFLRDFLACLSHLLTVTGIYDRTVRTDGREALLG